MRKALEKVRLFKEQIRREKSMFLRIRSSDINMITLPADKNNAGVVIDKLEYSEKKIAGHGDINIYYGLKMI